MTQHLLRTALTLVLCALLGGGALAGGKSKTVTFDDEVTVGDTTLKKGTYKVTFDDQTQELTFRRDGKVVAKAAARLEEYAGKSANRAAYRSRREGETGPRLLLGVNVGGAYAVIGGAGAAAPVNTAH
jgi:hypothetical protein